MEERPQNEPAPEPEDAGDEDYSDISLSEIEEMVRKAVREEQPQPEARPERDPIDEMDETLQPVARKTMEVAERVERIEAALEEQQIREEVVSTIERFEMTKAEVEPVVKWLEEHPTKARVLSFAEAAAIVHPGIAARQRSPKPAAPRAKPVDEPSVTPDTVGGSGGPPTDFKPEPGVKGYEDINRYVIANEASKLGTWK